MDFVSGARTVQSDQDRHILDLARGLDFLNPKKDGVAFAHKIGMTGTPVRSYKTEWTETRLARRYETVTINDSSGSLTVADANEYTTDELLRIDDEVVRVTAIADGTTLTVARGEADTTAAAHSDAVAMRIGVAREENSEAGLAVSDGTERLFNLVQTFDRPVELSTHAIVQLATETGNPLQGQVKRRYIEAVQQLVAAFFYGKRYADDANERYFLGGLKEFIETHVENTSGSDISEDALDDVIKSIVDAGGYPDTIVVNTTQKQMLDKLDNERIRTGKRERTGGGSIAQTWQTGLLDYELEVIVDRTLKQDELWVIDSGRVGIHPMSNNGAGHSFRVVDATAPGQDGKKSRILGHYTVKVATEKAHGYLHGLGDGSS